MNMNVKCIENMNTLKNMYGDIIQHIAWQLLNTYMYPYVTQITQNNNNSNVHVYKKASIMIIDIKIMSIKYTHIYITKLKPKTK